ncbi:MAG: hypothetical protein DMG93_22370, partial [Acidobacteria bacterium]
FVGGPTNYAYLIILPMNAMGPRESMRAQFCEEQRNELVCHGLNWLRDSPARHVSLENRIIFCSALP